MTLTIQKRNTASYDVLADSYDIRTYWRSDEEHAVSKYFTDTAAPLLVIGCGSGRVPFHLYRMGYRNITAVDISDGMLEKAAAKLKGMEGVRVLKADASNLPFADESFEYIFFPFHGIDYVPERAQAIVQMRRVLKPDGIMIFTSHNLLSPKGLKKFLAGKRTGRYLHLDENGHELLTYHTTMAEIFSLRKAFRRANVYSRLSLQHLATTNFKDKVIHALPFLDKSLYFIAQK